MNFEEYLKEEISDEDIEKATKAGLETAKEIFKDKYDEEKAKKTIEGVISKHKSKAKEGKDLSQIVVNALRS